MAITALIALAAVAQVPASKIQAPPAAAQQDFQARINTVKSAEGKPLPNFVMTRLDDTKLTNKDLKGKVVVIDFWATWCGPCKAAAPKLQAIYDEFAEKGLVVIGANLAERANGQPIQTKDNAVAYVAEHKYTYTFTYGNDALGKEWKVPGYPTFFVVGRDGNVKEVLVGFNENRMRQLVGELVATK